MRFGYMHLMPYDALSDSGSDWPVANRRFDPATGADLYDTYIDNMAFAETCGLDWVGCNEHHMSPYGLMANPNIVASAQIQRTKTTEIAVLGSLVPLLNPIRVAEEYAMLDVMSRGRLVAGLLRGIPHEYVAYNIAPDESRARLEEAINLIKKCWTADEPFGWEGEYYQFRAVSIWPKPYRKPYPRILMSGSSEESAVSCAKHGAILGLVTLGNVDEARRLIKVYKDAAKSYGWEPTADDILVGMSCSIDNDVDRAKERLSEGRKFLGTVLGGGIRTAQKLVVQKTRYFNTANRENWVDAPKQALAATIDDLIDRHLILCGTPKMVVKQIQDIHAAIDTPAFTARGQEPGWLLTAGDGRLVLDADYGQRRVTLPLPQRQTIPGGYRYAGSSGTTQLRVDVVEALCHDTMSGMPYPAMVTVMLDARRLDGCGGEPAALLQGAPWVLERLGDAAVLAGEKPTLRFGTDSRISGNGSCNSFGASYTLTGEGLSFSPIVSTKRACAEAARMQQENTYLRLLGETARFTIRPDGALQLETATGQTLLARPA